MTRCASVFRFTAVITVMAGVVWASRAQEQEQEQEGGVVTPVVTSVVTLSPTALTFNVAAGGAAPASQTLSVSGGNISKLTVSASVGANWLSISTSGAPNTNRTLTVSVNPAGLAAGSFSGIISVAAGGITQTAAVTLIVSPTAGRLTLTPTSLTFHGTLNSVPPASQTLSVTGTKATKFTAAASGANWLSISPSGALTTDRTWFFATRRIIGKGLVG